MNHEEPSVEIIKSELERWKEEGPRWDWLAKITANGIAFAWKRSKCGLIKRIIDTHTHTKTPRFEIPLSSEWWLEKTLAHPLDVCLKCKRTHKSVYLMVLNNINAGNNNNGKAAKRAMFNRRREWRWVPREGIELLLIWALRENLLESESANIMMTVASGSKMGDSTHKQRRIYSATCFRLYSATI